MLQLPVWESNLKKKLKQEKPEELKEATDLISMNALDETNRVHIPDKILASTHFLKGKTTLVYLIDPLKPRMVAYYQATNIMAQQIDKAGHLYLPSNVRAWLGVNSGDDIGFEIQINDKKQKFLILRKVVQQLDTMKEVLDKGVENES